MTPINRYLDAAGKATEGRWAWNDKGEPATLYCYPHGTDEQTHHGLNLLGRMEPDWNGANNLDFIAAARNASADIEKLVALNKALLDTTDATEIAVIKGEIRELVG